MILITGASKGIGKYLLARYLKKGERVFGTYHSTPVESSYEKHYSKVDVTKHHSVEVWLNSIKNEFNHVTLINCAGVNYTALTHKANPQKWAEVLSVNLFGTFNIINAVLPRMRSQNYGRIINFSSVVAQTGIPGTSAYAASKAGLWGLTKTIAKENAFKGITTNCLNLGYFDIGMIAEVPDNIKEIIIQSIPTKKFGDPINIFNTIAMIRENEYLNGSNIDINGALH